ncbi:MAG: hypothetical protein GKR88_17740 [Flavobacteriaceae bacterium]|nr:MAG: hypothetical protein GKR88_17740 [Flavobacteriaceae bacterium]
MENMEIIEAENSILESANSIIRGTETENSIEVKDLFNLVQNPDQVE